MGTRAQGIFGSLPILAVAFGRRHGIEVRIGGSQAYTNGKVIQLPAMPLECDERLETMALGYLYHEAGHLEFTDIGEFQKPGTPFLRHLLNTIEDVRMEAARNATYPGSSRSLAKLVDVVAGQGGFGSAERIAQAEPQDVLTYGVLTKLRSEVLGQPLGELPALWWAKLTELLGPASTIKLEALLGQMDSLDTTADALALATRIQTLVEESAQEPPEEEKPEDKPEDQPQDQQQGQGQSGESQDDGQSQDGSPSGDQQGGDEPQGDSQSGDPTGDSQSQSPSSSQDGGNGAGAGDSQPKGGKGSDQASNSQDQAPAPDRQALKQALQASADQFTDTDLGDVLGKQMAGAAKDALSEEAEANNGQWQAPAATLSVAKSRVQGQGEMSEVMGQSQQLRTRLAAAMDARAREKVTHRQQGARLDTSRVHRLFTGDTRVFARKEFKRKVNTAVQILLDKSGSMSGNQIVLARQAALAASVGIGQIQGCKVAAAAFPQVEILKEFDEQARGVAGRFVISAGGGTPLGEAMIWAASQLAPRREERKMLIVVTDGEPNDTEMVRRLVRMYQKSGVEVIGVGIGCSQVKDLYPVSTVINGIDELAGALFGVISERMRKAA